MNRLQELPIANSSFTSIRNLNQIYVDKTALIYELARFNTRQYFLARPRRFGKSLLVSTLESLFKDGLKMFKGLAIEKLWDDNLTYKVLHLDFSAIPCSSLDDFQKSAVKKFLRNAVKNGLLGASYQTDDFLNIADFIDTVCNSNEENSIVLLVDEYDSPLSANLNNPGVFSEIQSSIHDFYAAVKENSGSFRFVFITGVSRFSHVSIFSAGSSIADLSLDPVFGELLGYTENEIRTYFSGYLIRSAALMNHIAEEAVRKNHIDILMDGLREHYDGYCFDDSNETHVYQTWSVLNFLNQSRSPEFCDYWYKSGGVSTLLVNYFRSHGGFFNQAEEMTFLADDFSSAASLADMDPGVLLTQCGYYTVKRVLDGQITVGIPNLELQHAQAMLLRDKIFDPVAITVANDSKTVLGKKEITADECAQFFNKIFNAVSSENRVTDEYQACDYLKIYCIGSGFNIHREYHQKNGRADITIEFPDHILVVEMKFARTDSSSEKLLSAAKQQIMNRDYGNYIPVEASLPFRHGVL